MGRTSKTPFFEIDQESWRDIKGWHPYQVSDLGRVRRLFRGSLWMTNPSRQKYRKWYVVLSTNGRRWTVMVDRLVMMVFSPEPKRGRWIIHLDHNRDNNALTNLKYVRREEYRVWYREHFKAIGKTSYAEARIAQKAAVQERRRRHRETNDAAAALWLSGELTLKEAARTIGVTESALSYWVSRHGLKKGFLAK